MDAWWTKPLRAVTLEFPASDVATIDVKGIVDETHRGAVNMLNVFSIGYWPGGTAFYQSRIAPHYPGLGDRDLLEEAIEAGHRNGQKMVAYVASIWGGREMIEAHPDWAQRKADGRVTSWDEEYTSVAMCPNSPYREYFASVVREISEHYEVDGFYFDEPSFQSWCNCEHCRRSFEAETGHPLPVEEKWGDPIFHEFLQWRYERIAGWRRELYALVKQEGRSIFFQGAFPLATLPSGPIKIAGLQFPHPYQERFGVTWHVPMAHGDRLSHSAGLGDVVHFELYRRAVSEPLWWYGVSLKYGQSIGKGKEILVLEMMAQSPFDLYGLPESELRLSIAETIANCGSPLFARYYPDRVDREAWDRVYACLREVQGLEPYLEGRETIKYAALLFSDSSLEHFDHTPGKTPHLACLKGFAKALLQEHIPFDILTEEDLAERLADYKVLVLPNAGCLSGEVKRAISEFVAGGGGVVASYEAGVYDEGGNRAEKDDLSALFGVQYGEEPPAFCGFDVYMVMGEGHGLPLGMRVGRRIPTGGMQVGVAAKGSKVVASVQGGATAHYAPIGDEQGPPSALQMEHEGGGRAAYFAIPIGNRYLEFGVEEMRGMMAGAVMWAAVCEPPIRVYGLPMTTALTAYRQEGGDRIVIHLVDSVRDETIRPLMELPRYCDVRIELEVAKAPERVFVPGDGEELLWKIEGKKLTLTIPAFQASMVIVIA